MRVSRLFVVAVLGVAFASTTDSAGANELEPQSARPGAHVSYLGGPVVSHASIESVYWGGGAYEPGVGPTELPIVEFFQGVTDSPHMDWLSEYDTTNQARDPGVPPQAIRRGTYQGQTTITPSISSTTLSDKDIAGELVHQIDTGMVPVPQLDAAGQVQTVYAMFFPETITLTLGIYTGGEQPGFCAYHSTVAHDGHAIPFMVLPDFESHHFAEHCGDDPLLYNNFTAVTAHEILESVTDPGVGVSADAWIDVSTSAEIADICQPDEGTVLGGNGLTYVVALEFSNLTNTCIVSRDGVPALRDGYVNACGLAGRTGFPGAGLAADCLKLYGIALGKSDGSFSENDGLVRGQVSSLLARLIDISGASLSRTRTFADVSGLANTQVRREIEQLAGAGIITGFADGRFHPNDQLTVAQAATLVMRTLGFIHAANVRSPSFVDQGSTGANYNAAMSSGLLDPYAANLRGFSYATGRTGATTRGLLADMLAQSLQRLVDTGVVTRA